MTRPRRDLTADLQEAAGRTLVALRNLDDAHRALLDAQGGYRADTMPANHGSGGGEGDGGIGRRALKPDAAAVELRNLDAAAKRLLGAATIVYDVTSRWSQPARPGKPSEGRLDTSDWCANHLTVGILEPRHRGDLCRFCYDVKATEHVVPPPMLMAARARGERITQKLITEALGSQSRRKRNGARNASKRRRRRAA